MQFTDNDEISDLSSYETSLSELSDEEQPTAKVSPMNNANILRDEQVSKADEDTGLNFISNLRFEAQYEIEDEALEIKISPDRSCFVVALSSGIIRIFFMEDKSNKASALRLKAPGEKMPCNALAFTSTHKASKSKYNQHLLAVYSSGYVRLWNCFAGAGSKSLIFEWYESSIPCEFNNVSAEKPEPNEILCISLATDDSRFVTGGTDTVIKVYDFLNKARLLDLQASAKTGLKRHCNYHTSRVTALRYHPRGEFDAAYSHIFVSASWDNSVQIWDDRNTGSLWQYYGPHVAGSDGLDVEASQNLILTSSWTRSSVLIQMWKFADFVLVSPTHAKRRSSVNYSNPINEFVMEGTHSKTQGYVAKFGISGHLVFFTGSNNNILRIIDMENMATVAGVNNLPNAVYSLDTCFDRADKRKCMVIFTNKANVYVTSFNSRAFSMLAD